MVMAQIGFDWIWPPPFGLVESQKSISPCGGFNSSASLITHYLDQLRWNQSTEQISYMTRVSQDLNVTNASLQDEWIDLIDIQANLEDQTNSQFCVPVSAPDGFRSNVTAIFQLIANTPAGIIFAVCTQSIFSLTLMRSKP
jgi:hypothetical protein